MSLTQTYHLAHLSRGKLSKEAGRSEHRLRILVGHANLLDSLMVDLADAEREQESWFNQTVRGATKASQEPKHIQWADTIAEEEWDGESSDSEPDSDDEEDIPAIPLRRAPSPAATITSTTTEIELEEDMEDDSDYEDDLALTRSSSSHSSPLPELLDESDSDSEDDSMPPSPPQATIPLDPFSEKQRQAIATTSFYHSESQTSDTAPASLPESEQAAFFDEGFYLPQRQQTTIVRAY